MDIENGTSADTGQKAMSGVAPAWVWSIWYALCLIFGAGVMFALVYWLFDQVGII